MTDFDGNRDQHLANGGCPAIHKDGVHFCAGKADHYDWATSRHYYRGVRSVRGRPVETIAVEWN